MQLHVGKPHSELFEQLSMAAIKLEATAAFLSDHGARHVLHTLRRMDVDLTVSAYMGVTRKSALQLLLQELEAPRTDHNLRVRVAQQMEQGLHIKCYRYKYPNGLSTWTVGSANLTFTGLEGLGEVSAVIPEMDEDTVHGLGLHGIPKSMNLTAWARTGKVGPLMKFLDNYAEAPHRGGPTEEDQQQVVFLAGVGDASTRDEEMVEELQENESSESSVTSGPDSTASAVGEISHENWQISRSLHSAKGRLLNQLRRGDILIRGWKGEERVEAGEVVGLLHGTSRRGPFVVVFLDDSSIRDVSRAECGRWSSRVLRSDELPRTVKEMM